MTTQYPGTYSFGHPALHNHRLARQAPESDVFAHAKPRLAWVHLQGSQYYLKLAITASSVDCCFETQPNN